MTPLNPSRFRGFFQIAILAILIIAALAVYASGLPLPSSLHPDELGKAECIVGNQYYYLHPLMLLHMGMELNLLLQLNDAEALLDYLRIIPLFCSGLSLVAIFLLAGEFVAGWWRLGVVACVAATPFFAHHALYLKEDMIMLPWLIGGLWATLRWRKNPTWKWAVCCGLMLGLATASKYVGILLIVPILISIIRDWKSILIVFSTFVIVFLLIMLPAFMEPAEAFRQFGAEVRHIKVGHWIKLYPFQSAFLFHLKHNLIPGLGLVLSFGGILGWIYCMLRADKSRFSCCLVIGFGVLWYLAAESSISKPWIGGIRYVLPLVPIFSLGLVAFLCELTRNEAFKMNPGTLRVLSLSFLILVVSHNTLRTFRSLFFLNPDPRVTVTLALNSVPPNVSVLSEEFCALEVVRVRPSTEIFPFSGFLKFDSLQGADLFITSEFYTERFLYGMHLAGQTAFVTDRGETYQNLMQYPLLLIKGEEMPMPSYRQLDVYVYGLTEKGVKLLPMLEKRLRSIMPLDSVELKK